MSTLAKAKVTVDRGIYASSHATSGHLEISIPSNKLSEQLCDQLMNTSSNNPLNRLENTCLQQKLGQQDVPTVAGLPGYLHGPDEQCRQIYGNASYLCRVRPASISEGEGRRDPCVWPLRCVTIFFFLVVQFICFSFVCLFVFFVLLFSYFLGCFCLLVILLLCLFISSLTFLFSCVKPLPFICPALKIPRIFHIPKLWRSLCRCNPAHPTPTLHTNTPITPWV